MKPDLFKSVRNTKCQTRKGFFSSSVKFGFGAGADNFIVVFEPNILDENDEKCGADNEAEKPQSSKCFGHSDIFNDKK